MCQYTDLGVEVEQDPQHTAQGVYRIGLSESETEVRCRQQWFNCHFEPQVLFVKEFRVCVLILVD
jgi:hypothetical protein